MACIFCGTEANLQRSSGLDVCDACREGADLEGSLRRWGLTLNTQQSTSDDGVHHVEVRIGLPEPVDAAAHFRTELGADRFFGWLRDQESKERDKLFDEAVFVEEAEGPELDALLQDQGVQDAILALVATGGVRLSRSWIRSRRSSESPIPVSEVAIPLALLGVQLNAWTTLRKSRGSRSDPA